MTHRKDVVTFADIMENLDQIPKGDPFARGRGPADPLRERAMVDALSSSQLAERVRELEAECERMKTFAAQNFSQMIRQEAEQMREYGLSYEGVRKVLREHDDGEISFGKLMDLIRAAARAMAEDNQRAASNLLAIIHGDGGHYEDAHGTVKACKDAEGVVSELRLKLDAATHALGLLYEETTDPSRCTVELCAGDYRHHISEPCRLAVKKALRQHSLGEKLKDLLPPDWNKPDGVEGLE
jgi:hypothetical protein